MGLAKEAEAQRDIHDRRIRCQQHYLGFFDLSSQQVIMRPRARCCMKLSGKMHRTKSSHLGHFKKCYMLGQMGFNVDDNAVQAPQLQRKFDGSGNRLSPACFDLIGFSDIDAEGHDVNQRKNVPSGSGF